jgi:hypothetical protein
VLKFMNFTPLNKKTVLQLALICAFSLIAYLLASHFYYRNGFPLDDSWIHLTYARNLALHGEWAFQPGKSTAGSTAPLWTLLLAIGFLLKLGPYLWTYLLGGIALLGTSLLAESVARKVVPTYQGKFPWAGMFFALEWHLSWAAASGMETILHALLVTIVLGALMTGSRRFLALGLLTGLSVWVRPDGITLLGPIIVYIVAVSKSWKTRMDAVLHVMLGFGVLFCIYLFFNLIIGGTPMPNTFYAKQAEYVAWQGRPFSTRLGQTMLQLWTGPIFALVPGVIGWLVLAIKRRDWGTLTGMIWFFGYIFIYMERLPPYQHGRYIMPAMPVLFLWGMAGFLEFSHSKMLGRFQWMAANAWRWLVITLSVIFFGMGAWSYAMDVALIESEMVKTAKWVSQNIGKREVIAAHDIGALGYFDSHKIIDLAGLISPEVVPFIRDENRLADFLTEHEAGYLITFPSFYESLISDLEKVYVTQSTIAYSLNGENMVVFRWSSP